MVVKLVDIDYSLANDILLNDVAGYVIGSPSKDASEVTLVLQKVRSISDLLDNARTRIETTSYTFTLDYTAYYRIEVM